MSVAPEELDARAADYVLGLLTIAETEEVRADLAHDRALELAIARWETALTPLAVALKPETPPDFLWQRIEAELGVRVAASASITPLPHRPVLKRLGFWQMTTGAMALAAASLSILWLRPATPAAHYAAALAPPAGPSAGWLAETRADGALEVTTLGTTDQPAGKSLELWGLPAGATKPVSLGVLPASGSTVIAANSLPRDHLQLMVSLEPVGGSPTGLPTGPVLYAGSLSRTQ